jgi:hypothetical protein|tara:strand:- start:171 stop:341 length:171 start_codon:yes stop_codon:yes gene_type:complete
MNKLIIIFLGLLFISVGLLLYQSRLENDFQVQSDENRHTNISYLKVMKEVEKELFD